MEVKDLYKPLDEIKKAITEDNKTALFLMGVVEEVVLKMEEGFCLMKEKLEEFEKIKGDSQVS